MNAADTIPVLASAVTAETPALSLTVIGERAGLPALRAAWDNLVLRSGASVYQAYAWSAIWWEHYGSRNRTLRILVIRDGGEIIGIAPFYCETAAILGIAVHRHMALLGTGSAFHASAGLFLDDGPSDYLDIIAAPERSVEVADRIARYLREEATDVDAVEMLNVPPDGFCRTRLRPALEASRVECRETPADLCPRLMLSVPVAEYLRTLDASARRRFQQAVAAAAAGEPFALRACTDEGSALAGLEELARIHQRRWRKLGYPGLFSDTRFARFQSAVARAFSTHGWLRVTRADADGACVAVRLAFAHNGRLYDYLSGFDDAVPAAKRRPGLAILFAQMDEAQRAGISVIDFLRGDEPYKFELTAEARRNANLVARGAARRSAFRAALWALVRRRAFAAFLARREWRLLAVQLEEHWFPASLYYFARFRAGRLVHKFLRTGGERN